MKDLLKVTMREADDPRFVVLSVENYSGAREFEVIAYRATELWDHVLSYFGVEPEPGWVRVDDLPPDFLANLGGGSE